MGGLDGKWIRCAEVTLSLLSSKSEGAGPCCGGGGQHEYSLHLTPEAQAGRLLRDWNRIQRASASYGIRMGAGGTPHTPPEGRLGRSAGGEDLL